MVNADVRVPCISKLIFLFSCWTFPMMRNYKTIFFLKTSWECIEPILLGCHLLVGNLEHQIFLKPVMIWLLLIDL